MRIPKKVTIGGLNYEIVEASQELTLHGSNGNSQQETLTIKLNLDNAEELVRSVLLHEIFHCADSLNYPPSEQLNEQHIRSLSSAIFQVLKQNPSVRKFIFSES